MARELGPDEDHPLLELGRFLGQRAYARERLQRVSLPSLGIVLDWVRSDPDPEEGGLLVAEVKKSSRLLSAARLQLLFYLKRLQERGLAARGEIRIPKERKRIPVALTPEADGELRAALAEIEALLKLPQPPPPRRIGHCRGCAYAEFCWAELKIEDEDGGEGP